MNDVNFDVSAQEISFKVAEGGGSYVLPKASSDTLGGVKADLKTVSDTQPVRIDDDGKLWTKSGGGSGGISDVQINGTSVVSDGVANVPKASASVLGVVSTDTWNGTTIDSTGHIGLYPSQETHLNNRTSNTAITPKNLDLALKIGLTDGKAVWSDAEKASVRSLLGIDDLIGNAAELAMQLARWSDEFSININRY